MSVFTTIAFDDQAMLEWLRRATDDALDLLPFGVIGFDGQGQVKRYNRYESEAARFERGEVLGQHVFVELAPCLNNYLVATRFEEALEGGQGLDVELPYVLTFRMRPTRVRMRLLADPAEPMRYMLIERMAKGGA